MTQEQINNSFLEDIEKAVTEGYVQTIHLTGAIMCADICRKVYAVIGKYSAVPSEPKNEITNG